MVSVELCRKEMEFDEGGVSVFRKEAVCLYREERKLRFVVCAEQKIGIVSCGCEIEQMVSWFCDMNWIGSMKKYCGPWF